MYSYKKVSFYNTDVQIEDMSSEHEYAISLEACKYYNLLYYLAVTFGNITPSLSVMLKPYIDNQY